jgi:hypothetical protein
VIYNSGFDFAVLDIVGEQKVMLIYFSRKLSVSAGIGESKNGLSEVKLHQKQQLRQIVTMSPAM